MTETKKQSNSSYYLKLCLTLFLICAITALLLGLVNGVTADKIKVINEQKTAAAMATVLPADSYEPVDYSDGIVNAVYRAIKDGEQVGLVVEVAPSGFGGAINMVVGVDSGSNVTGVQIISMSETSGLGSEAKKPEFLDQFVGTRGISLVVKQDIDALTGATVTSRAVTEGVNAATIAAALFQ